MKRILAMSLLLAAGILSAQEFKVGSKVTGFSVQDLDGKSVSFATLRGPITVVTFVSVQCPVSNGYNQRMIALYKDYTAKDVKFIFVNANRTESASEVRNHAKTVGFVFPVYKDDGNVLADRFDAQVTPKSYLIATSATIPSHTPFAHTQTQTTNTTRT